MAATMTEVYFGGDGCPTCGRAVEEPWNRPHADWCQKQRRRHFLVDMATADGGPIDYRAVRDASCFPEEIERHIRAVARRNAVSREVYLRHLQRLRVS